MAAKSLPAAKAMAKFTEAVCLPCLGVGGALSEGVGQLQVTKMPEQQRNRFEANGVKMGSGEAQRGET